MNTILALPVICFGLILIILSILNILNQALIGSTIVISSLTYIYVNNKKSVPNTSIVNSKKYKLLSLMQITLWILSVIILINSTYYRSIAYIILISTIYFLISIEIHSFEKYHKYTICKIIITTINIKSGIYYLFPSLIGYDVYEHFKIAESIIYNQNIPQLNIIGKYASYPIYHLYLSISNIILNDSIKNTSFYTVIISTSIMSVFIYIISKYITNSKIALYSTILYNITHYNITIGLSNLNPGILNISYMLILIYFIFKKRNQKMIYYISTIIIISHQLTSFVFLIVAIVQNVSSYIHNKIYKNISNNKLFNTYIVFYSFWLIAYWIYAPYIYKTTFFESVLKPFISRLKYGGEYGSNLLIIDTLDKSIIESFISQLNYLILPFFTIGGTLNWIKEKKIEKFTVSSIVIVLYTLIFGFPLLGINILLTNRWQPILSIFASMIMGDYLIQISKLNKRRWLIPSIIIIFITFFMITTPSINKDSPIFLKENTIRNQFKYTEIKTSKYINDHITDNKIYVDSIFYNANKYYMLNSSNYFDKNNALFVIQLNEINITSERDLLIIRDYIWTNPVEIKKTTQEGRITLIDHIPNPDIILNKLNNNYNIYYNNNEVASYNNN